MKETIFEDDSETGCNGPLNLDMFQATFSSL